MFLYKIKQNLFSQVLLLSLNYSCNLGLKNYEMVNDQDAKENFELAVKITIEGLSNENDIHFYGANDLDNSLNSTMDRSLEKDPCKHTYMDLKYSFQESPSRDDWNTYKISKFPTIDIFYNLTTLKLTGNKSNINSIEWLSFIDAPILKRLVVEVQYIYSLDPLSKLKFNELSNLKLYDGRYNNYSLEPKDFFNFEWDDKINEEFVYKFCISPGMYKVNKNKKISLHTSRPDTWCLYNKLRRGLQLVKDANYASCIFIGVSFPLFKIGKDAEGFDTGAIDVVSDKWSFKKGNKKNIIIEF